MYQIKAFSNKGQFKKHMKNNIKKLIVESIILLGLVFTASNAFASGIPVMSTNSASNITSTSAVLNGYFNDNGSSMTSAFFDYGDSPIMGNNSGKANISGSSGNYSITVTGLQSGTTYYFKAVGINGNGFGWGNSAQTFTTTTLSASLPVVSTNAATNIDSTSATLNGYFNSKNTTTQTYFHYGTSSGLLNNATPAITQTSLFGNFSATISGLDSNTKYYFRAVAINSSGTSYATSILNFTTDTNGNPPPTNNCSINNSFRSDDYSVSSGDYVNLSWSTSNCSSANLSGYGSVSTNDNAYGVHVYNTTTFTLTAYGSNGSQDSNSLTVNVNSNPNPNPTYSCTINYFNPSATNIRAGDPVTFSWSTSNCNYVNFGQVGGNSFPLTGSRTEYPQNSTTYTLSAYGNNGTVYRSQYITVINNNCWFNCNPQPQPQPQPTNRPQAITSVVSSLKDTSATLHGTVYTNGITPTYVYFEYGTTSSLGITTLKYSIQNASSNFESNIQGLRSSTRYYFQFVAENSNGVSKGDIFYFTTPSTGNKVVSPVVVNYTKNSNSSNGSNVSSNSQNNQEQGNLLGASAGSASFLPATAIGWLLLIIFILVLFLIVRYFVTRESPNQLHR